MLSDELGRSGLDNKAARLLSEKTQKRSILFNTVAAVGVGAVLAGGAAYLGTQTYMNYQDWSTSPQTVENWKNAQEAVRQEKLKAEEQQRADEAIAKAREETEALFAEADKRAAEEAAAQKETALVEGMFARSSYLDALCGPYDIRMEAVYNKEGIIKEFSNKTFYSIAKGEADKAFQECKAGFPKDQFLAARGLGEKGTSAHYELIKDMFAKCGGVEVDQAPEPTQDSHGDTTISFRMWLKDGAFSSVESYKNFQTCLVQSLNDPLINTAGSGAAPPPQPLAMQ